MPIDNINDPWRNEEEEPEIQAAPPPAASPNQEQATAPVEPEEQAQQPSSPEPDEATARNLANIRDVLENGTGATRGLTETGELAEPEPTPAQEPTEAMPDKIDDSDPEPDWSNLDYGEGYDDVVKDREWRIKELRAKIAYAREHGFNVESEELGDARSIDAALTSARIHTDFTQQAEDFLAGVEELADAKYKEAYNGASKWETLLNTAESSLRNILLYGWDTKEAFLRSTALAADEKFGTHIGAKVFGQYGQKEFLEWFDAKRETEALDQILRPRKADTMREVGSAAMKGNVLEAAENALFFGANFLTTQAEIMTLCAIDATVGSLLGTPVAGAAGVGMNLVGKMAARQAEKAVVKKMIARGVTKELAERAAIKAGARATAKYAVRAAAAKRRISNMAGDIGAFMMDHAFNVDTAVPRNIEESRKRNDEDLHLDAAMWEAAGRTAFDYLNPFLRSARRMGREVVNGRAANLSLANLAREGGLHSAKTMAGARASAGLQILKNWGLGYVSFGGEDAASRASNFIVHGTYLINDEHNLKDMMWTMADSVVGAGVMAGFAAPGAFRQARSVMDLNIASEKQIARLEGMRNGERNTDADDRTFSAQRSMRDAGASPSFQRLSMADKRGLAQLAWYRAQMQQGETRENDTDRSTAERGAKQRLEAKRAYLDLKSGLSAEGRKWLAAYESTFDQSGMDAYRADVRGNPNTAARLASDLKPDLAGDEVLAALTEECGGELTAPSLAVALNRNGGVINVDSGNVRIQFKLDADDNIVGSVYRLDDGAMPERYQTEFLVSDFSKDGHLTDGACRFTIDATIETARELSSYAKWSSEREREITDWANAYMAGTGRKVRIVRSPNDLIAAGELNENGYVGNEKVVGDLPNGFSSTWRGFTSMRDGTIYVRADAFKNRLELAAILDHETFHSRFLQLVAQTVGEAKVDGMKIDGRQLTPERLKLAARAHLLGTSLDAAEFRGLDDAAVDEKLASIEESFAYDAEGMVPQQMRVPLFQKLAKEIPVLEQFISGYIAGKLGRSPKTQEEIADFYFTVMSRTQGDGANVMFGVPGRNVAEDVASGNDEGTGGGRGPENTNRNLVSTREGTGEEGGGSTGPSGLADTKDNRKQIGKLVIQAIRGGRVSTTNIELGRRVCNILANNGIEVTNRKIDNEAGTISFSVNQNDVANLLVSMISETGNQAKSDQAVTLLVDLAESMGKEIAYDEDGNILGFEDIGTIQDDGAVSGENQPMRQPAPKQKKGLIEGPKARTEKPKEPSRKTGPTDADRIDMARQKAPVAPKSDTAATAAKNGPRATKPTAIERGEMPQPRGEGSPLARGPEPTPQNARVPRAPLSPVSRTDLGETRVAEWLVAEKKTAANKTKTRTDANGKKTLKKPEAVAPAAPAKAEAAPAQKTANVPQPVEQTDPAKPEDAAPQNTEGKKPVKKRRGRDIENASKFASDESLRASSGTARFASALTQELAGMDDSARAMKLPGDKTLELTDGFTIGGLRKIFNNDQERAATFLEAIVRAGRLKNRIQLSEKMLRAGMDAMARNERIARAESERSNEEKARDRVARSKRAKDDDQKVEGRSGTEFQRANAERTNSDKALAAGLNGMHSIATAGLLSGPAVNVLARAITGAEFPGDVFDRTSPRARALALRGSAFENGSVDFRENQITGVLNSIPKADLANLLESNIIKTADDMAAQSLDEKDRADLMRYLGALVREADPAMADSAFGPNRKVSVQNPLTEDEMDAWTYENRNDSLALRELSEGGTTPIASVLRGEDGQTDIAAEVRNPFSVEAVLRAIEAVCENQNAPEAMFERRDALRNRLAQMLVGRAELSPLHREAIEAFNRERALLDERLDLRDFKEDIAKEPMSAFDIDGDKGLRERTGQLNPDADIADRNNGFYERVDADLGNGEETGEDRGIAENVVNDAGLENLPSQMERNERSADAKYAGVDTRTQNRGSGMSQNLIGDWADFTDDAAREDAGLGGAFASDESLRAAEREAMFLDGKHVFHATGIENVEGIVKHGLRRGSNVSYDENGQAFDAEGGPILVFNLDGSDVQHKGYQYDGITNAPNVRPVAILRNTSSLLPSVEDAKRKVEETSAALADAIDNVLKPELDRLGITEDEFYESRYDLRYKYRDDARFVAAYKKVEDAFSAESAAVDMQIRAEKRADSGKPQIDLSKFGLPVIDIRYEFDEQKQTDIPHVVGFDASKAANTSVSSPSGVQKFASDESLRAASRPSGVQKSADVNYPDAGAEISAARFASIGSQRKAEMARLLGKHRPDLNVDEVVAELEKFGTVKEQKAALHWVIRGGLALPQDAYKVADALSVAEKAKVDPFQYKSPDELLLAHKEFRPTRRPIDPATVPELSDPRDEGDGIVSYEVADTREGQAAMRRIIDTHWGEDANPWCLLARNKREPGLSADFWEWMRAVNGGRGEDAVTRARDKYFESPDAWESQYRRVTGRDARENPDELTAAWGYWQRYSALPKRVAFKDGKLLAFMATEGTPDSLFEHLLHARLDLENLAIAYEHETGHGVSFENGTSRFSKDFVNWVRRIDGDPQEWWDRKDESHPDLDWAKEDVGRSMFASEDTARMAAELEEKYPLMAVHGLSLGSLRKALDEGAFVMPSIAVRNHGDTWRQAGYIDEELSDRIPANQQVFVLFPKRTIADENTDMFYGDAYTPTINSLQGDYSQENIDRTREEFEPDITQPASRFNIGYLDDARLALREKNAELVAARDDATNSYIALIRELERAGVSEQRVHGEWMNIKAAYNTNDELTRSDIADKLRVRRVIPEQYVERLADALDKMIGAQYALDHDLSGATLVEAKAWRRVPFSEAAAVLIDNSAPKDVERILKYNGVENVVRINMADPNALADAQSTFAPRFASDDSLRAAEGGLTGNALSDPNIVALALGAVRVHNPDGSVSYSTNVTDLIRAEQFLNEDPKFAPWTGRQNLRAVFAEAGNVLRKDPAAAERIKEKVLDAYKKYQAGDKNAAARLSVSAHDVQVLRAMLVTRNQALVAANDAVADAENNGADNLNDLRVAELNAEAQYYDALMACGFAERAIGTALGSIARLMENDLSMGGILKRLGEVDGGVTAEESKRIRSVSREGEAAQKKHDDAVKAIEEEERKKLVAGKVNDAVGEVRRNKAAGRKEKTVAEAVEAARKELADGEMVDISVYPELWAQIGDAVKVIARAIIGEHLEGPSRLKALDHAAFARRLLAETNKAFEGRITSRDENHKELTERDVLNLFSDYGDPEKLQPGYDASRNVSTEQMREAQSRLKKLSQMMSALEDIKAGKAPLEAYGHLRDLTPKQVDEEMERVKKEMDEAWRASGLDKNLLHRAMSPLELVREGIEKRIAEIKANLAAGELAKKQGRKPIAGEEGLADLREELKRLQSIQDSVFKNRGLTDEQRLAAIEENYRRTEASAMATLQRLMAGGRPVKPLDMSDDGARSAWATAERAWRQKIGEARRAAADATRRLNELRQRMTPESYRGEKALERAIARREDMKARWEEAVNAGRVTLGGRGIMRDPKMRFDPRLVEADRAYREVIAKRDNLIAEIKLNHAKGLTKAAMYLSAIPNQMRQMMASGDNSGIGVQCAVATIANPIDGIKAIFPGIKVFWNTLFGNGMATERYMESIYRDPDFERIAAYVEIPRTDGKGNFTQNSTEEFFKHRAVAARLDKLLGIPLFDNRYMRASEAGFNVPVAMIRFELAKRLLAHLRDMKGEGYTPTNEEMSLLGKVVNAATGRGKFFSGGGPVNLSNVFWASGRVSGQVESLFLPARLFLKHGEVDLAFRKKIARELIWKPWRNFAAAALLFGLAHAIFKDEDDDDPFMELDPTSSKFLRMKVGTRYFDITSGMPSYITLAAKGIWGEKKTVGGKRVALRGQGAFGQSWSNELWRFFRNKLRPEYGNIISLFDGRNAIGEEIEPTVLGVSKFLTVNGFFPLTAKDIVDSIEDFDRNGPLFTASLALLANIGYTTSNFGQTPYKNDRTAIETIEEVRKQAEAGVEGMDDAWSDIALNEHNARYIKAASDKQMVKLAGRIKELDGIIRNGETTKDRKSGRVVSRRKLTREERRAAEREKDALEAEYHERLWPELKRIR